jgi:hypothetical protein
MQIHSVMISITISLTNSVQVLTCQCVPSLSLPSSLPLHWALLCLTFLPNEHQLLWPSPPHLSVTPLRSSTPPPSFALPLKSGIKLREKLFAPGGRQREVETPHINKKIKIKITIWNLHVPCF